MPTKTKLLIGAVAALLLVGALVISPEAGGVFAFVVPLTAAVLWATGITRTPRFVAQQRRAASERPRHLAEPRPGVPEREYREKPKWWARAYLFAMGVVPLALGLLCFIAAIAQPQSRGPLVVFGVALVLFGGFFTQFARQLPRMGVRIDPQGVEALGIFGPRRIAWDEIVAITDKIYRISGANYQTNHLIYGMDSSLEISGKLPGVEELMTIVRANATRVAE